VKNLCYVSSVRACVCVCVRVCVSACVRVCGWVGGWGGVGVSVRGGGCGCVGV